MKRVFHLIVCIFIVVTIAPAVFALELGEVQKISTPEAINCNPAVEVSLNGVVYVVWQGEYKGHVRIFLRLQKEGKWSSKAIIDKSPEADNFDPGITLDSKGEPHIVWVSKKDGASQLNYAYWLKDEWIYVPPVRISADKNIELPTIAVAKNGRVFIAWQEGKGVDYDIFCATQDEKGDFIPQALANVDQISFNIYPQLFLIPAPLITWFQANETQFELQSYAYVPESGKWYPYPLDNLDNIGLSRLPFLFTGPEGEFYALWYDSDEKTDRIFLAAQDPETKGKGTMIDNNPQQRNLLPFAKSGRDGFIYVCWCAEGEDGSQIFVTQGLPGAFQPDKVGMASDGRQLFYAHPQLAISLNSIVHLVWYSEFLDGGDGAIYYTTVNF